MYVIQSDPGCHIQHPRILMLSFVTSLAEYAGLISIAAINVPRRPTNKDECYVNALESDPKYAKAWFKLGVDGGGTVHGNTYTKDQRVLDGRLPS